MVFAAACESSLVAASGGHSSPRCAGLSPSQPLLLRSTGSRRAGSVAVAHGPSCSAACGIFPDQGSNPCLLHRQADSQPLRHQGSPILSFLITEETLVLSPVPCWALQSCLYALLERFVIITWEVVIFSSNNYCSSSSLQGFYLLLCFPLILRPTCSIQNHPEVWGRWSVLFLSRCNLRQPSIQPWEPLLFC